MAEPIVKQNDEEEEEEEEKEAAMVTTMSRKEKRKERKKMKRKQERRETADKERQDEERKLNDPEEQRRAKEAEEEEILRIERERKLFEERERLWFEEMGKKKKALEEQEKQQEQEDEEANCKLQVEKDNECDEDDYWEFVEEGPAEIIWQGNEIIVRKKKVRVAKKNVDQLSMIEDSETPMSNPLPPQSEAFAEYQNASMVSAQQLLENVAQQVPNFGTEQDKAHCPFHLKTGACRFGDRCSRVHFCPDKACTILIKNMYNGPGLAWEQDEGLEYTDEEVECCYEEFYEDVHTEFMKYGELVNFKVCKNSSFHLRGNVYVHYKLLDSAVLAYHSINGRYFAGKQVKCEFVNVTKWKVAICGEYMRSRLKTCSHGMACNFIHCFRNPGGDYEWADWDKPPPRYWVKKMASLFGYSVEYEYDKQMEQEKSRLRKTTCKTITTDTDRHHVRRSRSRDVDCLIDVSSKSSHKEDYDQECNLWHRRTNDYRKHRRGRSHDSNSDGGWSDRNSDEEIEKYRRHGHARKRSKHHIEASECPNRGSKNRTHGIDSSEEWSDEGRNRQLPNKHTNSSGHQTTDAILDDNRNHKNVARGAHGVENKLGRNRDGRQKHHSRRGANTRHHSKRSPDEHGDGKRGTVHSDSGSGEEQSYRDRKRGRHHNRTRKNSGHEKNISECLDNRLDDGHKTHGSDSSDDKPDSNKARHLSHERKHLSHVEPDLSGNEGEIVKQLKEMSNNGQSAMGKSHQKRSTTGSLKPNENRYFVHTDAYNGRFESSDPDSQFIDIQEPNKMDRWQPAKSDEQDRWQPERSDEDWNSRRKSGSVESLELGSPGQCNGQSTLLDPSSDYFHGEGSDDEDDKQYTVKSSSCDKNYNEFSKSRSRGSSQKRHRKRLRHWGKE